jgi:hypothetical protein
LEKVPPLGDDRGMILRSSRVYPVAEFGDEFDGTI